MAREIKFIFDETSPNWTGKLDYDLTFTRCLIAHITAMHRTNGLVSASEFLPLTDGGKYMWLQLYKYYWTADDTMTIETSYNEKPEKYKDITITLKGGRRFH